MLRYHLDERVHPAVAAGLRAYVHQQKFAFGELLQMLLLLDACYQAHEMAGRVEYL